MYKPNTVPHTLALFLAFFSLQSPDKREHEMKLVCFGFKM